MVAIELRDGELIVRLLGWDRIRALRSSVTVPFAHVAGVRAHPSEAYFDDAIVDSTRGVGTYVPGVLAVGTVELADGRAFYDVWDPRQAIAIDLVNEPLQHLVVEVRGEAPEETVQRIQQAVWH